MNLKHRATPLSVLPCAKCGGTPKLAFDLISCELWGRIFCPDCQHTTKTTSYLSAKGEWNAQRSSRPTPS